MFIGKFFFFASREMRESLKGVPDSFLIESRGDKEVLMIINGGAATFFGIPMALILEIMHEHYNELAAAGSVSFVGLSAAFFGAVILIFLGNMRQHMLRRDDLSAEVERRMNDVPTMLRGEFLQAATLHASPKQEADKLPAAERGSSRKSELAFAPVRKRVEKAMAKLKTARDTNYVTISRGGAEIRGKKITKERYFRLFDMSTRAKREHLTDANDYVTQALTESGDLRMCDFLLVYIYQHKNKRVETLLDHLLSVTERDVYVLKIKVSDRDSYTPYGEWIDLESSERTNLNTYPHFLLFDQNDKWGFQLATSDADIIQNPIAIESGATKAEEFVKKVITFHAIYIEMRGWLPSSGD